MNPIIDAKISEKIAYMENPPAQGGEIQYLTSQEFQQKFNCEYSEGVVVTKALQEPASEQDFRDTRAKAAYERLQHPLKSLVICKMTDEIGYGLFTTEEIPIGTVICIYAGAHDPSTTEFIYSYGEINAAKVGGFARFMQHQPISKSNHEAYLLQGLHNHHLFAIQKNIPAEKAKAMLDNTSYVQEKRREYKEQLDENEAFGSYDFEQYQFSNKQLATQIAQSNVSIESTKVAGVEVILMVASRNIKRNESIGFSYGVMYWQHPSIRKPPLVFTETGQVIPPENNYNYKMHASVKKANNVLNTNPFLNPSTSEQYSEMLQGFRSLLAGLSSSSREIERDFPFSLSSLSSTPSAARSPDDSIAFIKDAEVKLHNQTVSFFKNSTAQWKKYPESGLVGKYIGHQVRFFTMGADEAQRAKALMETLQQVGFDAELKKSKDKPSIVVDLTTSKLTPR